MSNSNRHYLNITAKLVIHMQLDSILYIAYSDTSITVLIIVALLFWNHRKVAGAKSMAIMMSSASLYGLCKFMSDLSYTLTNKVFWTRSAFWGLAVIPAAWFIFTMQYTKRGKYLTRQRLILLFIIPLITISLACTNDFHHLIITNVDFVKIGQMTFSVPNFGAWFWIHAAYSYSLFLYGTFILVGRLIGLPKILRNQSIIILIAILIPLVMNTLYTFNINPVYPMDPTIFSFTITGILCFLGMFRFKLFELIPAARNAVIEGMNEILIVLDNRNHIIDMNSAAKEVFEIKEKDFIGKPAAHVLGEWAPCFAKYELMLEAEEKISINIKHGTKHFDFRITPLFDDKNRLTGRFYILYDITVLEDAIVNLEESRKAAEDANKAKSQFLATMSHEIRTPLNGIIGVTELLNSSSHTEEEKGYLQTVQSCAGSLLGIINDVLDFSKIEAGKMELEEDDINIGNLINTVTGAFLHLAKDKDIALVWGTDDSIPQNLMGDSLRIRQILTNLIGNAFKFTEKGKIEIRAEQLEMENQKAVVRFSVADSGIGVPEDKIDNLFKSFQQVDGSTTRKYGGTGLGLAIVKELVSIMGGYVHVESKFGEGSIFSFTIPFKISGNKMPAAESDMEIDFGNRSITVLLAEDNKVNQMLIAKSFEKKKIKVDIAGNGKEALYMMDQKSYDLILMDIQMPVMDGYEATRAIREKEADTKNHIPIIALTANATEADRDICIRTGMDDYLTKPIKSKKLYECIYKYVICHGEFCTPKEK